MERAIYKHIEQILRDYPDIEEYVHERRQELMQPYDAVPDENIGGGRSNVPSKPLEDMVVSIADDRRLAVLEQNKKVVDECLKMVDDDTVNLITELYFKKHPMLTIGGVAVQLHSNRATMGRKRTKFFELVKSKLGW